MSTRQAYPAPTLTRIGRQTRQVKYSTCQGCGKPSERLRMTWIRVEGPTKGVIPSHHLTKPLCGHCRKLAVGTDSLGHRTSRTRTPMNAHQAKKLRQLALRAASQPMKAMRQAEQQHLQRLQQLSALRPKPRFIPLWLWTRLQRFFLGQTVAAAIQPQGVQKVAN